MARSPSQADSNDFLARLRAGLAPHSSAYAQAPRINIALSGGLDSSVALQAFTLLEPPAKLRALHVDHALNPASEAWRAQAERLAQTLGVAFEAQRVVIRRDDARGLEAAAREARYEALRGMIGCDEVLVTGHHADDQLETVLLRLLRGAGVRGLTGIASWQAFHPGYLARPLLEFTRAELAGQARAWGLDWVEDPSNADTRFDRNFLRATASGPLLERWPGAARAAVRLAGHMLDAERNLEALAELDLGVDASCGPVAREPLRALAPERQRNALRWLVRRRGLPMPDTRQLEMLRESLEVTRRDASVLVTWPGGEARVYDDRLYLHAPLEPALGCSASLGLGEVWKGGSLGELSFERCDHGPGLPDDWVRAGMQVRFREGGERFKPLGRAHTRPLKRWLQDDRVLPWMRDRIPLLYRDTKLVAVADLWLHDDLRNEAQHAPLWRVSWRNHPPIH